jgi:hypothetical protein
LALVGSKKTNRNNKEVLMREQNFPILHVYPQNFHHSDAYLVANQETLVTLKAGIEEALYSGNAAVEVSAADGEGYELKIQLIDKPMESEDWKNAALPYSDEAVRDKRPNAIWPWQREESK